MSLVGEPRTRSEGGGIVDLPLIVTREDEQTWFSGLEALTEGRRWVERDAELRGETDRLQAELRENLLGGAIWDALEPASRAFLATGEAVYRARRDDPGFDFSGPAVEYAKTAETELNALIFSALRDALGRKSPAEREIHVDARRIDLGGAVPHQTLGAIRNLLEHQETVAKGLRAALQHDANWLLGELPHRLAPLIDLRNPAAHDATVGSDELARQRQEILGIGCEGLLVRIVRAKLRR